MTKIITIRCGMNNCFVIYNEDKKVAVLVDTLGKRQRKLLLDRIKNYPIKYIIITHGHFDHVGNAAFFKKHFHAKVLMSKLDLPLLKDNCCRQIHASGMMGRLMRGFSIKAMRRNKIEPFTVDGFLEDGQDLNEIGIDAKIVALPGHTAGSIGIQSTSSKSTNSSFIVGDALVNMGFPSIAAMAEDMAQAKASGEILKQSGAQIFYLGHGEKINYHKIF